MKHMQGVFDIGGTGWRAATANLKFEIRNLKYGATSSNYIEGILMLVKDLESSGAESKLEKVAGCIAGKFNEDRSKLVFSPNLPDWVDKPIKTDLERELGCEVILENDAAAEALGEAVYGAGVGYKKFIYFTAGTGIGGSLIQMTDDNLPAGRQGWQIADLEPGWTIKIGDKFLEEVAGGKALGDITKVDWVTEAKNLAFGINELIKLHKPEITILGGSLFKSIDMNYLESIVNGKIILSKLGQEAGLYGCMELLRQSQG